MRPGPIAVGISRHLQQAAHRPYLDFRHDVLPGLMMTRFLNPDTADTAVRKAAWRYMPRVWPACQQELMMVVSCSRPARMIYLLQDDETWQQ
jgi:hypothetical protein